MRRYLGVTLSLLLLLSGWWWSEILGFLVPFGYLIPIMFPPQFRAAFAWLVMVCAVHLWWPACVACSSLLVACLMSGALIAYFVIAGMVIRQIVARVLPTVMHGVWVMLFLCWALWLSAPWQPRIGGYPFLHPAYPVYAWLMRDAVQTNSSWMMTRDGVAVLSYVPPALDHPLTCAQKMCNDLYRIAEPPSTAEWSVIISPESSFPFPVTDEVYAWWAQSLPYHVSWIVGVTRVDKQGAWHQSALLVERGKLPQWYDKQTLVSFFETPPGDRFEPGPERVPFVLGNGMMLHLCVCADVLCTGNAKRVCVLANETHVPSYIAALFGGAVSWHTWQAKSVWWASHARWGAR